MAGKRREQKYWERFLTPGEELLHTFGIARRYIFVVYVLPALASFAASILLPPAFPLPVRFIFAVGGLGFLLLAFFLTFFVRYAITNKRVMGRVGVLARGFRGIDFVYITDLTIKESWIDLLITRTGSVGINTAGSPGIELTLQHVARPFDIRRDIHKHRQDAQSAASLRVSAFGGIGPGAAAGLTRPPTSRSSNPPRTRDPLAGSY